MNNIEKERKENFFMQSIEEINHAWKWTQTTLYLLMSECVTEGEL